MKHALRIWAVAVALLCLAPHVVAQKKNPDSLRRVAFGEKQDTGAARALCELAVIYRSKEMPDSARYFAQKGLELSVRTQFKWGHAMSLYQLAIQASNKGDYVGAMERFTQAADIYRANGDKKGYASALSALGAQKTLTGDLLGALDYYHQSLIIKETLGDSAILASTLSNIGVTYNQLGNQPEALMYYKRSLRLNLKYGKLNVAASDYYNIGNAYASMKQDSLALVYTQRAAHLSDSLHLQENLTYSYGLMGKLESRLGRMPEAIVHLEKALALAETLDDPRVLAFQRLLLGDIYAQKGNSGKALALYMQAYETGKKLNSTPLIMAVSGKLSDFYDAQGDSRKALMYYKEFIAARDSVSSSEKKQEVVRKEMNFEFEKRQALARAEAKKKEELDKAEQLRKDAVAEEDRKRKMLIIYAGSAVLLLVLFFLFLSQRQKSVIAAQKKEVERQRDMVNEQKLIIEEKNKDITDSINYAQKIQQAIFPEVHSLKTLLPESFILFRPRDIVSGDFYWFTEKDGKLLVAAVDCTGHGVPGAFMSMIGTAFLKEIVNGKGITKPSEVLSELRFLVIDALKQKGESGEQHDGMDISLCCFSTENGATKLEWAGANNPLWIVRNKECIEIKPDKRPIGFFRGQGLPFTSHEMLLEKDDMLFVFTDGFADQFGGPKGKKFKYSQLQEKLVSVNALSMYEQREALEKVFDDWKGSLEQVDDVLLIGIRV